jgi:hypothetical protein
MKIKPDIGKTWPTCLDCGGPLTMPVHPMIPWPERCERCAPVHELQVKAVNRAFGRRA